MARIELYELTRLVQEYISKNYSSALLDKNRAAEIRSYIGKYLYDTGYTVDGYDTKPLVDRLYSEMC